MKTRNPAQTALALLLSASLLNGTLTAPLAAMAQEVSLQSVQNGTLPNGTFSYTTDPSGNLTSLNVYLQPESEWDKTARFDIPAIAISENPSVPISITINGDVSRLGFDLFIPVTNANTSTVSMVQQIDGSEKPAVFDYYCEPDPQNPYDQYGGMYRIHATGSENLTIKNDARVFDDVSPFLDGYPSKEIAFMSARDLMSGVSSSHFSPDTYVTRAQIATILFRRAEEPTTYDNTPLPAGVLPGSFYARASKWAVGKGLMAKGAAFNGESPITREQLALILFRLIPVPKQSSESIFEQYPDLSQMSNFNYINAFAYLIQDGIMGQGTNSIRPLANCTRAEVAAMLARWIPQSTNEALYQGAVSPI